MKRALLLLTLLLASSPLYALGRVDGYAERGNLSAVTNTNGNRTPVMRACPGATIDVFLFGTATRATLYSNASLTAKSNPMTADSAAYWYFYAADGEYTLTFTCSGSSWSEYRKIGGGGSSFEVHVTDYGARCDGTTDDLAAINAALAVSGPHTVRIPSATCKFTDTLIINQSYVRLVGYGAYVSNLNFVPASGGKPAILISAGASIISYNAVKDLRILSTDTTLAKTAIKATDTSYLVIDTVVIGPSNGFMGGGASVGIHLQGREVTRIIHSLIYVLDGIPLLIDNNPNSNLDSDLLHVEDFVFVGDQTLGTSQPVIKIAASVHLTSNVIENGSLIFGGDGIQWIDSGAVQNSAILQIRNVRREQERTAGTWLVYIDHSNTLRQLDIQGMSGGANSTNGIFLRDVTNVTIKQFLFLNTAGVGLNVDGASVNHVILDNNYFIGGSTLTMTSMRRLIGFGKDVTSNVPSMTFAVWESTLNASTDFGILISDAIVISKQGTLAAGASVSLPMQGGAVRAGLIQVTGRGTTILAAGTVNISSLGHDLVSGDSDFAVGNTAGKLCVQVAGSSAASLINNTAESIDYIYLMWYRNP